MELAKWAINRVGLLGGEPNHLDLRKKWGRYAIKSKR